MAHTPEAITPLPPTFGHRFGYACWLYHLQHGRPASYRAIGRAIGRTGEAVAAWLSAEQPPPDFKVHEPTAAFLAVDDRWLFRNEGSPPKAELWVAWIAARQADEARRAPMPASEALKPVGRRKGAKRPAGRRRAS